MSSEEQFDNLDLWELKPFGSEVVINWHGTYGYPVVHRVACVPKTEGTHLPAHMAEDLLFAERHRRAVLKQKKLEFCSNCMVSKKKVVA